MASTTDQDQNTPKPEKSKVQITALSVEIIEALTPISLAVIGGVLGFYAMQSGAKDGAGFTVASTALAGAAGISQPFKKQN